MTTVEQFLDACRADLGYMETPVNQNKFSTALHRGAEAWCHDFLVAKADEAGLTLPAGVHGTAYTWTGLSTWQQVERSPSIPQPGDWAYFRIGQGHVGVVESVAMGTITTLDGNTIPEGMTGDQANGGMVCRKTRSRTLVAGYGRPDYETASPSIGDLFMDLGPRATVRILHVLKWGSEPTVTDLDAGHFLLGQAVTDDQKDAVVATIFDQESKA